MAFKQSFYVMPRGHLLSIKYRLLDNFRSIGLLLTSQKMQTTAAGEVPGCRSAHGVVGVADVDRIFAR